jgi:hypothetical protein
MRSPDSSPEGPGDNATASSSAPDHGKPPELQRAQDEVLRKIGRNVLLFQEIEALFKHVVVHTTIETTPSTLTTSYKDRVTQVQKQTLGIVVGRFTKETLVTGFESFDGPGDVAEPKLSLNFKLEIDGPARVAHEAELEAMVDARNELIHQLAQRHDFRTMNGCEDAVRYLESQFERYKPMRDRIRDVARYMDEERRALLAHLASEDGQRQIEVAILQQSRLISSLVVISMEIGASDGWVPLATAGRLLHERLPDVMSKLKERYGHRTLKPVLIASELFDVREQPTANGGARTEFRVKPKLSASEEG